MPELKSVPVWDAPTRIFHWVNALCVLALAVIGLVILNGKTLEIPRTGTLKLKVLHAWIGYVFALNLLVRIAWAFIGNRWARWGAMLPGGRGFLSALGAYVRSFFSSHPQEYLGHNPLGRLSVTAILLVVVLLAVSGLVLAGTDLFYPPFGRWFARWVAAPGVDPAALAPNSPAMYDKAAYDGMRNFRKPFMAVHLYGSYTLMALAVLHVIGVIITEVRERSSIISATFTGRKVVAGTPVDAPPPGAA